MEQLTGELKLKLFTNIRKDDRITVTKAGDLIFNRSVKALFPIEVNDKISIGINEEETLPTELYLIKDERGVFKTKIIGHPAISIKNVLLQLNIKYDKGLRLEYQAVTIRDKQGLKIKLPIDVH